jgi:histidine triad (HIT) family protein
VSGPGEVTAMSNGCLFCGMASGAIDAPKLHDDDLVFAVRDINPRAPVHVLIVPKQHIADAGHVEETHAAVLARMISVAGEIAVREGVRESGYRLAFNVGDDAGMTIHHLHMHLLGGRALGPEG